MLSAPGSLLFSGPKLGEQPQNVDVDPDQREHQPEGCVPLHVLRGSRLRCLLDEVEIEREVQRPQMTIRTLIPMPNGVGAYRKRRSTPRSDSSQAAT